MQFDPTSPQFIQDPYPVYRALRENEPIHHAPALGGWVFTRHEDVRTILNAREILRPPAGDILLGQVPAEIRAQLADFEHKLATSLPFSNPPDHTRLRALVGKAFTSPIVQSMRPRIQRLVDGLLDKLADRGRVDLLADYAYHIPSTVIMDLVGVPAQDHALVVEFIVGVTPIIGQSLPSTDPVGIARAAAEATEGFGDYLDRLIAARREDPRNDLITALVSVEDEEGGLTRDELTLQVLIMLIAGTETTTHYINNGVHTLLRNPDKAEQLRAHPEIIETAAEELLRFEGSVPISTPQVTVAEVEIGGRRFEPGQLLFPVLGAGNRDPARFPDPDEIDLLRPRGGLLSFGGGIHVCFGRHLAMAEAQIAIGSLLRRFPHLRLDEDAPAPVFRPDPLLRGLLSLPVRCDAA